MAPTSRNRAGKVADGLGPGDADDPLLQGLAQGVEHGRGELAQLVEEEHAVAGPGHLARAAAARVPPPVSATGEAVWCGARKGGVVGSSPGPQRLAHGGADRGPPRGPRRPRAAAAAPAGGWPASSCPHPAGRPSAGGGRRRPPPRAPGGPPPDPARRRGPAPRPARPERPARRDRAGPATARRPGAPRRPRPGDGRSAPRGGRRPWPRRPRPRPGRRPSRTGEASTRLTMPRTGRSEPSRPSSPKKASSSSSPPGTWSEATSTPTAMARSRPDPALRSEDGARFTVILRHREVEAAVGDRGPDPVPGLPAGGVGQADDGEARQAGGEVDLDPDGVAVDAEEAGRGDGCEHGGPSAWSGTGGGRDAGLPSDGPHPTKGV